MTISPPQPQNHKMMQYRTFILPPWSKGSMTTPVSNPHSFLWAYIHLICISFWSSCPVINRWTSRACLSSKFTPSIWSHGARPSVLRQQPPAISSSHNLNRCLCWFPHSVTFRPIWITSNLGQVEQIEETLIQKKGRLRPCSRQARPPNCTSRGCSCCCYLSYFTVYPRGW